MKVDKIKVDKKIDKAVGKILRFNEAVSFLKKRRKGKILVPPIDVSDEEKTFDVGELNRHYFKMQEAEELEGFGIRAYGRDVYVDLRSGDIYINGERVNLELPKELEEAIRDGKIKLRFINFKRHVVSKRIGGETSTHHVLIGIGWQTTYNGKNYQRFIMIWPNGYVELRKKR